MLLFSSALSMHKLTFLKLSDFLEYVPLAARWTENEWGYIRNKGVEYREGVMQALSNHIYLGFYAGRPVGMFALLEKENNPAYELMYVYVEKDFRGLGFGKQIIEEAKNLAQSAGAQLIFLDTLKPSLNRLYQNHGAEIIGEGTLFSHPTDVLAFKM